MHAIAPYSIRFFDPNNAAKNIEDRYAVLDKLGAHDAYTVLCDFVRGLDDQFSIDEVGKQVYRFFEMKTFDATREVAGWFESGSYGYKNDIIDIETGKVDYEKTQKHAEIIRHYIRFFVPKGFNEGVALLQTFKGNGIKTLLHDVLRTHFQKKTTLNLQMNPLAYKKAFLDWENAYTKEIKLTKFQAMDDLADQIKKLGHKESQLIIKAPTKAAMGRLKDLLDPNSEEYSVVEYLSPMCAQVKAVVELNGKKRTFTIGRPADEQVCEIPIDEEDVDFFAGNPVPKSLHKWCGVIQQELVDNIYPGMGVVAGGNI